MVWGQKGVAVCTKRRQRQPRRVPSGGELQPPFRNGVRHSIPLRARPKRGDRLVESDENDGCGKGREEERGVEGGRHQTGNATPAAAIIGGRELAAAQCGN